MEEKAKPKFPNPVIEPEPSYDLELEKIEAARSEVQQLETEMRGFEGGSAYTPLAWQQLPLEGQRRDLSTLQQKLERARADLKVAIAGLNQAKDAYRRQVAVARAKAKIPLKKTVNPVEKLQVLQELKQVEEQIQTTDRVKAPQAGIVKKVRWLGMQDQTLQVEVSLAIQESKHLVVQKTFQALLESAF